jgi:type IV pilus assembly protein PilZ
MAASGAVHEVGQLAWVRRFFLGNEPGLLLRQQRAASVGAQGTSMKGMTLAAKGAKADLVSSDREDPDSPSSVGGSDRRTSERVDVTWSVDCEAKDTFLYASITNVSEMGIFVQTKEPLEIGTHLTLRFSPPGHQPFVLRGIVQWVNAVRALSISPNPGMGIRFVQLTPADRERLVEAIRTFAYVPFSTTN